MSTIPHAITEKVALITGANRGLGRALTDEALSRGARRVYAGSRQAFTHPDERVVPLILDVTDAAQIAAVPVLPAYSASKAAAFALTQSLRALLAGRSVRVHAVLAGPIDTDMVRELDVPKTPPEDVARGILDGVQNGDEDIFPDPFVRPLAEGWDTSVAKELERQNALLVQAGPAA